MRPVSRISLVVDIDFLLKLDRTDLFDGCPVGLQLIGKTLEEEAVLRMTTIVDDALRQSTTGKK